MTPGARLLDLTRLAGRASRVLTGVDRVERAYLRAIVADDVPGFGLVRTALGFLLLDDRGLAAFDGALDSAGWGAPGLVSRLVRRADPGRAAVEGFLRRHAIGRCTNRGLPGMLARRLPAGTSYVNVGQTTLRPEVMAAVRRIPGARVAVMIHDTIPLDHPEWQRPGTADAFARRFALARSTDLVIANSHVVAADCRRHMESAGPKPPVVAVHLGVDLAQPDPAALPPGLDTAGPYFVVLGTIEPRKNHALLLDVWEMLGPAPPRLFVVGARGWCNEAVFGRLDAAPAGVTELPGLGDGAVAALLQGARALLFPSFAEGFGLPALEAAGRGVPVVCGDLAIWRELLADWPIYAGQDDRYLWVETVRALARPTRPPHRDPVAVPQWPAHFKTVLNMV